LEKKKENFKNQFSLTLSLSLGAPAYPESSGEINSLSLGAPAYPESSGEINSPKQFINATGVPLLKTHQRLPVYWVEANS